VIFKLSFSKGSELRELLGKAAEAGAETCACKGIPLNSKRFENEVLRIALLESA